MKTTKKILPLTILTIVLSLGYGEASENISQSEGTQWKPNISEEKKEKIQPLIAYFMEAQEAEMEGDDDFSQGFPWRSFRASIEALQTPEAAGWIIETLPHWVDGRDQESLALLSKKAGALSTPKETEMLLTILNNENMPESSREWGIFILENIKNKESKEYLKERIKSEKNPEICSAIKSALGT